MDKSNASLKTKSSVISSKVSPMTIVETLQLSDSEAEYDCMKYSVQVNEYYSYWESY